MSGWPTASLGEVVDVRIGPFGSLLHKEDYTENGVPLVNPMHIDGGSIVADRRHSVKEEKAAELAGYRMMPGDVVLGRRGEMGRCAVVQPAEAGFLCGTGSLFLRPDKCMSPEFLAKLMSSPDMVRRLERESLGTTMPNLNRTIVSNIQIMLPPIEEQRRIAAILDHADALRAKRREALARLDELTQSIFIDMFGAGLPTLSDRCDLGEKLSFLTSGSRGWAKHYADEGQLFLRIQNVGYDELRLDDVAYVQPPETTEAKRTKVQAGDVLLSITADLGRTAVVDSATAGGYINQHLAILRTDQYHPAYLSKYLSSSAGQNQISAKSRGGTKAGLNFDDVRSLQVPCPPIAVQCEYARRAETIGGMKSRHRAALTELDDLFASLQSRAFRGEL
ncbi:restriction endonuclease subunit S [Nocardia sp. 004]|uniref:restriction endonuclease subunit S n=1 Tax=Nocardia sp. 004 TaxID=3385978 RepID=UPI0039A3AE29